MQHPPSYITVCLSRILSFTSVSAKSVINQQSNTSQKSPVSSGLPYSHLYTSSIETILLRFSGSSVYSGGQDMIGSLADTEPGQAQPCRVSHRNGTSINFLKRCSQERQPLTFTFCARHANLMSQGTLVHVVDYANTTGRAAGCDRIQSREYRATRWLLPTRQESPQCCPITCRRRYSRLMSHQTSPV